jgi:DNA topoisomerase I
VPVVIVESPAKAKTINKYLGRDYTVLASYGHIRDLPSKDGSVDPDADFEMIWEVDAKSAKRVKDIAEAIRSDNELILATDPDREGEAISWHIVETLAKRKALKDKTIKRVVFNAITKGAVTAAMKAPRDIDMELVDAYLARRALDYLVGFKLSPVLWRKLPGARSAGRVQSVSLRLIVEREYEIERFISREFWSVDAQITSDGSAAFTARLITLDGKKLDKFDLTNEEDARRAAAAITSAQFRIASVEAKPVKRNPPPPFTTSTLQQEAARKLGFSASRTMQTAQKLYEGVDIGGETTGLITYMRTDGVQMAQEGIHGARETIRDTFGPQYCPKDPRFYATKAKNAQEAHEAIRPTDFSRQPKFLRLEGDLGRLYDLIWKRAIASQMASAELERTTIDIFSGDDRTGLRATGSVVTFDGFLSLYQEGRDDSDDEGESRLPRVSQGATADISNVVPEQHFTQPPPRFTEASLVKRMEELGIGRPSTYASTLTTLRDREYVRMDKSRFIPEDKGRLVTAFLEKYFARYVEYAFTADLEAKLDLVSSGDLSWKEFLRDFWRDFSAALADTTDLRVSEVLEAINQELGPVIFPARADGSDPRACQSCGTGTLSLKTGKFGAFIGCSNYPECRYTRQLGDNPDSPAAGDDGELGRHPDTGDAIFLKTGRFGPYVEMASGDKPIRSSVPKAWQEGGLSLDRAILLLSLPRQIGAHPEDGEPIEAGLGRFGPFIKHGKTYANVASIDEVFEIGINRAVTLIAEKRANPGRGARGAPEPLRRLGDHPQAGGSVDVMKGRYGAYVKHDKINATLPKGITPETITLEQAVELIAARGGSKAAPKAKAAAKKAPAKKAPAKKAPAKKAPAAKTPAQRSPARKAAKKDG